MQVNGTGKKVASSLKEAVVFVSHFRDQEVESRHRKLEDAARPHRHVFFLYTGDASSAPARGLEQRVYLYDDDRARFQHGLESVGRGRVTFPGNMIRVMLAFAKDHPDFDHYWWIEYDVVFTGCWETLFSHFEHNDADLLATSIHSFEHYRGWSHWRELQAPVTLDGSLMTRAFLPVYRISRRALELLPAEYGNGWSGHFEATVPTILRAHRFRVEDIGGSGPFVAPENKNRFYTSRPFSNSLCPGTFRYRPARRAPGTRPDTLWHPVKPWRGSVWRNRPPLRVQLSRWLLAMRRWGAARFR